jgi:succinate dehydrogenase flavin-adding protein (antitoxin of CptAB toxin-antitoxin module)
MRELDELLLRYLEARYPIADDDEKAAFQAVLALPDPELNGYLLQRQAPSSESVSGVINIILNMPQA